ncbi:MAG: UbiA family prenyltransferase [Patescibacteria group bacterium]|nr:UbiA family prenyltransferase [Patescibacteria group bacterium]MDE2015163.1 UbiA family prenyltransferase [Patescibacteria group bacterium]MDE2226591.1 UbiA family prenyltransferase [Patescibacteria group bacterium]
MLKKLLVKIENANIGFKELVVGFSAIVFVRIFLENFSSIPLSGVITSNTSTILHYFLYYTVNTLSVALILGLSVGNFRKAWNFILFGLLIEWLPPIYDLIVSAGNGYPMHYPPIDSWQVLLGHFFMVGGGAVNLTTPGQTLQISLIVVGILIYVILSTKSITRGVVAALLSYSAIFFWATSPTIIKVINDFFHPEVAGQTLIQFFSAEISRSMLIKNFLHPTISVQPLRAYEIFFGVTMSSFYYIAASVLIVAILLLMDKRKTLATLGNSRMIHAVYYYAILVSGFLVAINLTGSIIAFGWLDSFSLLSLAVASFCARMFAVGINDLYDIEIDKISHPKRPLPSKTLTEGDIKDANLFFLIWALVGAFIVGHYVFFMMLVIISVSYIYSAPPLRLKRIPLFANFLMSLAYFSLFASGFFMASADQSIRALPIRYLFLITIVFTLGTTVKDLKDIDGDRAAGVMTIPVIIGRNNGRRIIGLLLSSAFFLVPIILNIRTILIPSLIAAIAGYLIVVSNHYKDNFIFILYIAYIIVIISIVLSGVSAPLY